MGGRGGDGGWCKRRARAGQLGGWKRCDLQVMIKQNAGGGSLQSENQHRSLESC